MSEQHAQAYRALRERVTAVVRAHEPGLSCPAPATSEWSAHDLLAHLVGVPEDVVHGRLDGIASDAWTQAQVDKRRDAGDADLLAEWDEFGPQFEQMLVDAPDAIAGQAIFDAVTHEFDLRHALGAPGGRDSDALTIAWDWIVAMRAAAGLPAVRFVTEAGTVDAGTGEPKATVHASRFELLRAISGRRSAAQIEAYDWDGPADPSMLIAADIFRMRTEPLAE